MITTTRTDVIGSGVSHVFCTPEVPAPGKKYRLVLRQHGAGSSYREALTTAARYALFTKALCEAGLAVLFVDSLTAGAWGNDTGITRLSDAWTYAKANLPVKTDGVLLLGQSAGNLWGMNWARQNLSDVIAIASVIGVVDLQDVRDNNRQSLQASIDAAYGGNPSSEMYATHSPAVYAAELAGVPQRHWYSTDDTVCIPSTLAAYCAAAGVADEDKIPFGAVGHSIGPAPYGTAPYSDIAAWLAAKG